MRMPEELRAGIAEVSARVPAREMARAAEELSRTYRDAKFSAPVMRTAAQRAAYLQVRMPATYAALRQVLSEAKARIPGWQPKSLLDLGAGPGTAAWAAVASLPTLERLLLVERDAAMVEIGRGLARRAAQPALREAEWRIGELPEIPEGEFDLVVASYALGELAQSERETAIRRAWRASRVLVVVEPGTKRGFEQVLAARAALLDAGALIAAPCPHGMACPMAAAGDWCHFSARLERTAAHRRMKSAELGYEDEKFAYLVAAKAPVLAAAARVVRHPLHHGGHTQLVLCTPAGLEKRTVTRSQKDVYRRARTAEWGGAWE